ncbi:GntR family transcriptional regulator [Olsenella urininfantis]|uniref:GntR family transcriptional regulator n=1 Tax=Olsenella urininfantis TaxID=1871033 RepID=UPI001356465F|nr:GntR family transcriptional regulator [Olsenella urininfantis]
MTKQDAVYQDLRGKILSGSYASWGALENECVLCERYGVSRPTLQKAVARLKQEGLVHSRQGSGVFVNPPEFFSQYNIQSFTERYAAAGKTVESKVLRLEEVPANELSDIFRLGEGETLIHYERQRLVDGEPTIVDSAYLPRRLFEDFDSACLTRSVFSYIEHECGYAMSHSLRSIRPFVADARISKLLDVEIGRPLLKQCEVVYLARNVVLSYSEEVSTDPELRVLSVR